MTYSEMGTESGYNGDLSERNTNLSARKLREWSAFRIIPGGRPACCGRSENAAGRKPDFILW